MEEIETPALWRKPSETAIPVPGAAAPAPYSAAPECAGSSDRRTKTSGGKKAQCGLCTGKSRRRQASAERAASRTDGPQSQCSPEFRRGHGRNFDSASASRPHATAEDARQHQEESPSSLPAPSTPAKTLPIC